MKRCVFFIIVLLAARVVNGQANFRTIVPQDPVIVGESFRVQYAADNTDSFEVMEPTFHGFRLIRTESYSSPNKVNYNNHIVHVAQNMTFTLEALEAGRFLIPATSALIDGKWYKSKDEYVVVITEAEARRRSQPNGGSPDDMSMYTLAPGEDPYKRINRDLFVKVTVDRYSCFVGQPVVATFKLYTRLPSHSDIVKNPGFYGFSMYDMISLGDKRLSSEMVNGRPFDVHTIRQVQLYPLQEGKYTIEPMEIKNKIDLFIRQDMSKVTSFSFDGKNKTKIREGVIDSTNDPSEGKKPIGVTTFENSMSTEPVTITVKGLPENNKPADFNSATGNFTITTWLAKDTLARNEEGHIIVTIRGAGNFNQLSPPSIQWPDGVEAFEPMISDSLDKGRSPLTGTKTFNFGFVSAKQGNYQLPEISFSFFDPATNSYKRLATPAQPLYITHEEKAAAPVIAEKKTSIADTNRKASLIAGSIIIGAVLIALIYWFSRKKEVKPVAAAQPVITYKTPAELLSNAYMLVPAPDNSFYRVLQRAIWDFFRQHFDFAGSGINKHSLAAKLDERNIDPQLKTRIMNVLQQCETGIYTGVVQDENRETLLNEVKGALDEVHADLLRDT
ncbi:MAG TPA: BatD family protein [Chitinophagaceae bacterium]|jgi:hypothetical protein|nr:BatD family protein [Chitinophagaceae bacterium]